jgi:type IV pilus assembly protein PilY1
LNDPVLHSASGQASPIVRLNNGKFGVLVPNGFGSANGQGVLFILFVDGPVNGQWTPVATATPSGNYVRLTHTTATTTESANGYMGATWADLNNDTTADVIYVTDVQGKVWKYDVRDADPLKWGAAFKNAAGTAKPFFATTSMTGQALSITTSPVVTFPQFGGAMVSFGTGKAIENGDFPNWSERQRFFSVWDAGGYEGDTVYPPEDKKDANGNVVQGRAMPDASNMLEILLARDTKGSVYRYEKKGTVDEPVPSDKLAESFDPNGSKPDGWFFNFPSEGEQLIYSPSTRRSFISFNSVRSKNTTENESSCTESPYGTFYGINPGTGQAVVGLLSEATPSDGETSTAYGEQSNSQRVVSKADSSSKNKVEKESCMKKGNCDACKVCPAGQTGERRFGNLGVEESSCKCLPNSSFRIQWREISGMRTQ